MPSASSSTIKSCSASSPFGISRRNTDLSLNVQIRPFDSAIDPPTADDFSAMVTCAPASWAVSPAISPDIPPPRIKTSLSKFVFCFVVMLSNLLRLDPRNQFPGLSHCNRACVTVQVLVLNKVHHGNGHVIGSQAG